MTPKLSPIMPGMRDVVHLDHEPRGLKLPERLGEFWEWKETDGPAPWVWRDRYPGEHCAWTCIWNCADAKGAGQLIEPEAWGNAYEMTTAQMLAELDDIASRPGEDAYEAHLVIFAADVGSDEWRQKAVRAIGRGRARYQEYVSPLNPPKKVFVRSARRGWSAHPETQEAETSTGDITTGKNPPEWMEE